MGFDSGDVSFHSPSEPSLRVLRDSLQPRVFLRQRVCCGPLLRGDVSCTIAIGAG